MTNKEYSIRDMVKEDWNQVKEIYAEALKDGKSTFTKEVPSYEEWDKNHLKDCRFVLEKDDKVVGWCALSKTSARDVYKGVVEISIYFDKDYRGMGLGEVLMDYLCKESERIGYWTLVSVILSVNFPSIKLHEKCGFRKVGYREKIAKDIFGRWQDTFLYEKRSQIIWG